MTLVLNLIYAALTAVILIEICDRIWMHIRMHRRVVALDLANNAHRCEHCAKRANNDNRKQNNIQHRAVSFGRMKQLHA